MEFEVTFKFSDVIRTIEADSLYEAQEKANKIADSGNLESYCYEFECDEVCNS